MWDYKLAYLIKDAQKLVRQLSKMVDSMEPDNTNRISMSNKATDEAIEKLHRMEWDETFKFRCHKGVSCWTDCCANSNLFLTPYDILRLKKNLRLPSSDLLEKHVTTVIDPSFGMPVARLNMNETDGRCPFVTEDGCSVYEDRPTACRVYPLGQAASSGGEKVRGESFYFKIEEDHCKGWQEPDEWEMKEWVVDQGISDYNMFNDMIVQLTFNHRLGSPNDLSEKKLSMIFMALYDLDRFRSFVFESSLLDRIEVEPEVMVEIKKEDEALLKFAMRWIELSVMGIPSLKLKEGSAQS